MNFIPGNLYRIRPTKENPWLYASLIELGGQAYAINGVMLHDNLFVFFIIKCPNHQFANILFKNKIWD